MNCSKLALAGVSYYQISRLQLQPYTPPSLYDHPLAAVSKVEMGYVIKKSYTAEMLGSELGGFTAYHKL